MAGRVEYSKFGAEAVGFTLGDSLEEALSVGTRTAAVAAEMLPEIGALLIAAPSLYTRLKEEQDPAAAGVHEKVEALDIEYGAVMLALEGFAE